MIQPPTGCGTAAVPPEARGSTSVWPEQLLRSAAEDDSPKSIEKLSAFKVSAETINFDKKNMIAKLFRVFFLLICLLICNNISAQNFKVGQRVEVNYNGHWYKSTILQVSGERYKVHYDGYPASDDAWLIASYIRTLAADGTPASVTCNFNVPAGSFTNNSPASEGLFKRELYDWYARLVNGTLTRPTAVGVVYKSFTLMAAYKNTVENVPGQGAMRKHSGAPPYTMIYPVKTTYFVCEQYSSGVSQKEVNANFSFFKNKDGEWTCSKDN